MNKNVFLLAVVIGLSMGMVAHATEQRNIPGMMEEVQKEELVNMVSGVVQDVQGDWCVVQDAQGTEWKIQVDHYTDTIGNVLPGATIIAMVEPDGHATEVKVISN